MGTAGASGVRAAASLEGRGGQGVRTAAAPPGGAGRGRAGRQRWPVAAVSVPGGRAGARRAAAGRRGANHKSRPDLIFECGLQPIVML